MKNTKTTGSKKIVLALLVIGALAVPAFSAGILRPVNGDNSAVTLKSHKVSVTINNGFARTEVDQLFYNSSSRDLEAVYSFPIPKSASLSELSLWMNGKEVIGEVLEKKRAREIYTQETRKRVDPALAEKTENNTFEISVFPVVAKADTRLRLVYYQPITIDSNVGRYAYPLAGAGSDDDAGSFWSIDEQVKETFSFDLTIKSAFPVKDVRMPGYEGVATISNPGSASGDEAFDENADAKPVNSSQVFNVHLDSKSGGTLNKDLIVYYRLDDEVPARVELIPYRKDNSSTGTFMVVVTPAAELKKITEGSDWTFLLDASGSMRGTRIQTLVEGVKQAIEQMSPEDRFRIVAFSSAARDVTGGYMDATPENVQEAVKRLSALKASGRTDLYAGMLGAYKKLDEDRTTGVILITDGVVKISSQQHNKFLRLLEEYDVRIFSIVIGNAGDQGFMERLAKDSGGFTMNISDSDDVVGRIMQAKTHLIHENMHNVQLKIDGVKVKDITPQVIGNLYHGQQLVMFGRYDKPGDIQIELKAKVSGEDRSWSCDAVLPEIDTDNPELERLWALSSIEDVMQIIKDEGETSNLRSEVINLGTEYSLVTDYTSMLVIMEQRFEQLGIERKNDKRVKAERQAQQKRSVQPVKSYRVDQNKTNPSGNKGAFDGKRSPGFGSGPVGPAFIALTLWLKKRKRN